jgi:hypothetical protein
MSECSSVRSAASYFREGLIAFFSHGSQRKLIKVRHRSLTDCFQLTSDIQGMNVIVDDLQRSKLATSEKFGMIKNRDHIQHNSLTSEFSFFDTWNAALRRR